MSEKYYGPSGIVELKVKSMEHGILAALSQHESNIQEQIRDAVSKVVDSFDMRKQVENEASYIIRQAVTEAITEVFRPKIQQMVKDTLKEIFKSWESKEKRP